MRIAVYGAGAIGGHLAVSLASAGADVSGRGARGRIWTPSARAA